MEEGKSSLPLLGIDGFPLSFLLGCEGISSSISVVNPSKQGASCVLNHRVPAFPFIDGGVAVRKNGRGDEDG